MSIISEFLTLMKKVSNNIARLQNHFKKLFKFNTDSTVISDTASMGGKEFMFVLVFTMDFPRINEWLFQVRAR